MTTRNSTVLLLSGGLDSAALAAWIRPAMTVFVRYGQKPQIAEENAARAVAAHLTLPLEVVNLPLIEIGGGLMLDDNPLPDAPSPEWWPFRNQFLATVGAAVAVRHRLTTVALASVRGDGDRHVDGSARFYEHLDAVLSIQEGHVQVSAPAVHLSTPELLAAAGAQRDLIGWTVSCHRANEPCGDCPGCWKRELVLAEYIPTLAE